MRTGIVSDVNDDDDDDVGMMVVMVMIQEFSFLAGDSRFLPPMNSSVAGNCAIIFANNFR